MDVKERNLDTLSRQHQFGASTMLLKAEAIDECAGARTPAGGRSNISVESGADVALLHPASAFFPYFLE